MLYLYSFLGIVLGILVLKYTYKIRRFFGIDPDMDRVFKGLGGTYLFIKMFGLALIVFSLFFMFGIIKISA